MSAHSSQPAAWFVRADPLEPRLFSLARRNPVCTAGPCVTAAAACRSSARGRQGMDPFHRDSLESLDLPDVFEDFTAFVRSLDHSSSGRR